MTYDIAVWEGPKPPRDAAAGVYAERMAELERNYDAETAPTVRLSLFIDELLAIWPEIDTSAGDDSPWAMSPLMESASGKVAYLNLVAAAVEEAIPRIVEQAKRFELVCYDPQIGELLD